jgi:predicted P-loop ATPase/GTPase
LRSIFIFGLFQDSSGKTVLSSALARGFANVGLDVAVFKPRSGHNMWYQYGAYLKCKAARSLFCEDIIKLKEASKCPLPYEVLNPVDALLSVFNTEAFLERKCVSQMFLLEQEAHSQLIVERHSILKDGKAESVLLLNEGDVNAGLVLVERDYLEELKENAAQVIPVHGPGEWAALSNKLGAKAIQSCYSMVKRACSSLVIEGFNDSVCPEPKVVEEADVIAGVAPGAAIFYEPNEFKRILNTMAKLGRDPKTLRSNSVIKFARKYKALRIPQLPPEYLNDYDRLSVKLGEIVDYASQLKIGEESQKPR